MLGQPPHHRGQRRIVSGAGQPPQMPRVFRRHGPARALGPLLAPAPGNHHLDANGANRRNFAVLMDYLQHIWYFEAQFRRPGRAVGVQYQFFGVKIGYNHMPIQRGIQPPTERVLQGREAARAL